MRIWAIGDLHLSFGIPDKGMEVFGEIWENHSEKIAENWKALIAKEDLILIPGDISWAMKLEDAVIDLEWIDALPGTKVMIKGNHDYWWGSLSKVVKALPPSIHLIQNNAFHWKDVAIGGARLWDTPEYSFSEFTEFRENPRQRSMESEVLVQRELNQKIFERELLRLRSSLEQMNPQAKVKIAMLHYPPISHDLKPSRAAQILEEFQVNIAVFGHLHSIKGGYSLFGEKNGVRYLLTSADYLRFQPLLVL